MSTNAMRWWLAALLLTGCAEPDKAVTRATEDHRFSLSLRAEKNWLHPGEVLPVLVRVESLSGPLPEGLVDTVKLFANNGALAPALLVVSLAAANSPASADSAGAIYSTPAVPDTAFENWTFFTASPRATPQNQGEINALFQDVQATLKVRITPPAESL